MKTETLVYLGAALLAAWLLFRKPQEQPPQQGTARKDPLMSAWDSLWGDVSTVAQDKGVQGGLTSTVNSGLGALSSLFSSVSRQSQTSGTVQMDDANATAVYQQPTATSIWDD